jgi:transposase-like protein
VKAYSGERKEAVLRRMMPPENKAVSELARETGITEPTLSTWRRQLKSQTMPVPGDGKNPEGWSSEDQFAVVLETAALNEAQLAEYSLRVQFRLHAPYPIGFPALSVHGLDRHLQQFIGLLARAWPAT